MDDHPPRLSWPHLIGRYFLAFALGFLWNGFATVSQIACLQIAYGDFIVGLGELGRSEHGRILMVEYFAIHTGSFFGGLVGVLALGRAPWGRVTTLASSAFGALIAIAMSAAITIPIAWGLERTVGVFNNVMTVEILALAIGALSGVVAGWLAARLATRRQRLASGLRIPDEKIDTQVFRKD